MIYFAWMTAIIFAALFAFYYREFQDEKYWAKITWADNERLRNRLNRLYKEKKITVQDLYN